jgi:hypothetical protein
MWSKLRQLSVSNKSVPVLLLLLAGCASSPSPRAVESPSFDSPPPLEIHRDDDWDGAGGAAGLRTRGEELASLAMHLRGTPYRYGGATREGFDCSGLVFFSHRQLGLTVPRTSRDQAAGAREIKPGKLRRGDLVFFRIGSRNVNHVGIYIGERKFVHAPGAGKPVTVNSLDDEYYEQRFSSAGRYWDRE